MTTNVVLILTVTHSNHVRVSRSSHLVFLLGVPHHYLLPFFLVFGRRCRPSVVISMTTFQDVEYFWFTICFFTQTHTGTVLVECLVSRVSTVLLYLYVISSLQPSRSTSLPRSHPNHNSFPLTSVYNIDPLRVTFVPEEHVLGPNLPSNNTTGTSVGSPFLDLLPPTFSINVAPGEVPFQPQQIPVT